MAKLLRREEFWQFEELKRAKALKRFSFRRISEDDNISIGDVNPYHHVMTAVFCGDGHHSEDKFNYLERISKNRHLLTINGGGHWLDPQFKHPEYSDEENHMIRELWVRQIVEAYHLKGARLVCLKGHYPCGVATGKCGMGPADGVQSMARAAIWVEGRLREFAPTQIFNPSSRRRKDIGFEILPLYHKANGQDPRTYLIDVYARYFDFLRADSVG